MSHPQQHSLASLLPRVDRDGQNPFADDVRQPATPVVLEAIDKEQTPRSRSVSVLCPGCSRVVRRYPSGIPARLTRFSERCEGCEAELKRWSVLAVDTAHERTPEPRALRQTVTEYWEQNLWSGIVTGETAPRTREYSKLYNAQADTFEWDWTVTCPLCRRERSEIDGSLDYHHWRYETDEGICLCRVCHDALSGQRRDTDLDWTAQQLGLRNKHDLQICRLALRHQAVADHDSLSTLTRRLHSRYNLPQPRTEVFALLSQTLSDQEVLTHVDDEHLLVGLGSSSSTNDPTA